MDFYLQAIEKEDGIRERYVVIINASLTSFV